MLIFGNLFVARILLKEILQRLRLPIPGNRIYPVSISIRVWMTKGWISVWDRDSCWPWLGRWFERRRSLSWMKRQVVSILRPTQRFRLLSNENSKAQHYWYLPALLATNFRLLPIVCGQLLIMIELRLWATVSWLSMFPYEPWLIADSTHHWGYMIILMEYFIHYVKEVGFRERILSTPRRIHEQLRQCRYI